MRSVFKPQSFHRRFSMVKPQPTFPRFSCFVGYFHRLVITTSNQFIPVLLMCYRIFNILRGPAKRSFSLTLPQFHGCGLQMVCTCLIFQYYHIGASNTHAKPLIVETALPRLLGCNFIQVYCVKEIAVDIFLQ